MTCGAERSEETGITPGSVLGPFVFVVYVSRHSIRQISYNISLYYRNFEDNNDDHQYNK